MWGRIVRAVWLGIASCAALSFCLSAMAVKAQPVSRQWREIETESIFGFTEGSGIGEPGDKEISLETEARLGKSGGRYFGSESKLGFEFTPNRYVQFELGPFATLHSIKAVDGLDDRTRVDFGGVFGEIHYLLIDRSPSSPLSVTLSAEPEWGRIDEASGERAENAGLELKANADVELIRNRLYLATNLLYDPEATHDPDHIGAGWQPESKAGVSGALSYRIASSVMIGAEIWYLRHYDGAWLNYFTGDAVYVGPALFMQINRKMYISAAWNVQVAGSEVGDPAARLNLAEFSRHRAKLKLAVEF